MKDNKVKILEDYFNKRYQRWLDYSRYHCSQNGLAGEEEDVLMKVIEDVWQKDKTFLYGLYQQKKKEGTGLDFYVLRILYIYIKMPTAPYRWSYHTRVVLKSDIEFYENLPIIEVESRVELNETMDLVKKLIYCNHFSKEVVRILEWIYIKGNKDFSNWAGTEDKETLERIFNKAMKVLQLQIVNNNHKFKQLSIF